MVVGFTLRLLCIYLIVLVSTFEFVVLGVFGGLIAGTCYVVCCF